MSNQLTGVNKSAQKVLKVLKALRGHSLNGLTNQQLAEQLRESPSQITRALQTLVEEGLATQNTDGSYSLSISMLKIANAHADEIQRAEARIAEFKQRTNTF